MHHNIANPAGTNGWGTSGENGETASNQEGTSITVMRGQLAEMVIKFESSSVGMADLLSFNVLQ